MAELSPASPRGRQRRKAARPQELLDAALDLFVENGLAATRAEDVAHRAGVSKGTLYLYYPSKDELFKAVVRSQLSEVLSTGEDLTEHFEGPTSELLQRLTETWWTKVGSSKAAGLLLLIMSEARAFPDIAQFYLDEVVAPSHTLLSRVIDRGIQRGEFRKVDTAAVVHGMLAQTQYLILHRQCVSVCTFNPVPMDPQRFMQTQLDLLMASLKSKTAHS